MKINKEISFDVSDLEWNEGLVHQVAISKQLELRSATSQQKSRSDVRGGGRKPWKQKGTGRARAGTIRSPLWKGGGVTFANKNRNFVKKINKKMYAKAVQCVLFRLQEIKSINFIDDFALSGVSTKDALKQLKTLFEYSKKNKLLIVDSGLDENKILSFRNAVNVDIITTQSLGILQLLNCDKVIITKQAHAILNKKYLTSKA